MDANKKHDTEYIGRAMRSGHIILTFLLLVSIQIGQCRFHIFIDPRWLTERDWLRRWRTRASWISQSCSKHPSMKYPTSSSSPYLQLALGPSRVSVGNFLSNSLLCNPLRKNKISVPSWGGGLSLTPPVFRVISLLFSSSWLPTGQISYATLFL